MTLITVKLCTALGLKPLDRVQVNDAHEIREMSFAPQLGYEAELPFLYFQRSTKDGRLEVRSPSGYVTTVAPEDVCDLACGEPVIVRAMPKAVFVARLAIPRSERGDLSGPECYADAHVLYVTKDRWGRIDQTFVWFLDESLNDDRPWPAPIHADDRAHLEKKARRTTMPIMSRTGGTRSADQGIAAERAFARCLTKRFIACAVAGDRPGVEMLAMAGAKRITQAALNKLAQPLCVAASA